MKGYNLNGRVKEKISLSRKLAIKRNERLVVLRKYLSALIYRIAVSTETEAQQYINAFKAVELSEGNYPPQDLFNNEIRGGFYNALIIGDVEPGTQMLIDIARTLVALEVSEYISSDKKALGYKDGDTNSES